MQNQEYFVANKSLIYLKLKTKRVSCNREVYETDLIDVFLLEQFVHFKQKHTPITQKLPKKETFITIDYTARDMYIYNKLLDMLEETTNRLEVQHCLDIRLSNMRVLSAMGNFQQNSIKPTRIDSTGTFVLNLGEILYKFRCVKKQLSPVYLTGKECYKNGVSTEYSINSIEFSDTL